MLFFWFTDETNFIQTKGDWAIVNEVSVDIELRIFWRGYIRENQIIILELVPEIKNKVDILLISVVSNFSLVI